MKQQKPKVITFRQMVMNNVNAWRKKQKLPPAGHESPQEFRKNFNSVAAKLEVSS